MNTMNLAQIDLDLKSISQLESKSLSGIATKSNQKALDVDSPDITDLENEGDEAFDAVESGEVVDLGDNESIDEESYADYEDEWEQ